MLATAARRSYLDKHNIGIAAGLLLRVAEHTGETAQRLMTRLRIPQSHSYLIRRCGEKRECARGDMPPPIIKRFLDIHKTEWTCYAVIDGEPCTCTQQGQRIRCKNRGPSFPEDSNPDPWLGDGL